YSPPPTPSPTPSPTTLKPACSLAHHFFSTQNTSIGRHEPLARLGLLGGRCREHGRRGGLRRLLQGRLSPRHHRREVQGRQVHRGAQAGLGPFLHRLALARRGLG